MIEAAIAVVPEAEAERGFFADLYTRELEQASKKPGCDLPTFYLGKLAEFEAVEEAIREQAKAMLGAIQSRRRALAWALGAKFKLAVETDLKRQTGKKKSVDYITGRAGFRATQPSLSILDEPALKDWCLNHCEAALELKIQRTTPIKEYIKKTGEVPPGAHWKDAEDRFYPSIDAEALPAAPTPGAEGGAA